MAPLLKKLPAIQETQVQSLGWEETLEKELATHSSILAWSIPWIEEQDSLQSMGLQNVRHNCATFLFFLSDYEYKSRTKYGCLISTYNEDQQWEARAPGMSSGYTEWLKVMSLIARAWQNVVHWGWEWQTISVFLPWEPHEQYEKTKIYNTERWTPQVGRCPIYYWGRAEKWLQK